MKGTGLIVCAILALVVAAPAQAQDAGTATPPSGADAGVATPPAEGTPTEATPGEGTPDEGTPEGTPGEGTPDEGTPGEGTPDEGGTATVETTEPEPEPEPEPAPPPTRATGQTEDTGEPDEEPAQPRPAWRNSTLRVTPVILGLYTLAPGLTDNPFVASELELAPRWYFNDTTWVRARWGFNVEWTQNDGEFVYASLADYEQEPVVTDLRVDLNRTLFTSGNYKLAGNVGFRVPLSTTSLANSLILGGYVTLSPTYVLPDVLSGLTFRGSFVFDGRIYASQNRQLDTPIPCQSIDGLRATTCGYTASWNAPYQSIEVVGADLAITDQLSIGLDFTLWQILAFSPPDSVTVDLGAGSATVDGSTIDVRDQSETSWTHLWGVGLSASYEPVGWLGVSLAYSALTGQVYADTDDHSTDYRNPFWNIDSSIQLDVTFTPDQLIVPPRAEARRAARRLARAQRPGR